MDYTYFLEIAALQDVRIVVAKQDGLVHTCADLVYLDSRLENTHQREKSLV